MVARVYRDSADLSNREWLCQGKRGCIWSEQRSESLSWTLKDRGYAFKHAIQYRGDMANGWVTGTVCGITGTSIAWAPSAPSAKPILNTQNQDQTSCAGDAGTCHERLQCGEG
jgi:hypothetical protein